MSLFEANVRAVLDKSSISSLEAQIKNLGHTEVKLSNVTIGNTSMFTKAIQNALSSSGLKIDASKMHFDGLKSAADNAANQFSGSFLKSINLVNGGIGNMQRMLQGAGFNTGAIKTVTQDLANMNIEVKKISTTMSNGNIKMNIAGVDELGRAVSIVREYEAETGKVANTSKSFTQTFKTSADFAKEQAEALKQSEAAARAKAKADQELAKETERAAQAQEKMAQTQVKSSTLSNQMTSWMNQNANAAKVYGDRIRDLQRQLSEAAGNANVLSTVRTKFAEIKSEAQAAGLTTNTFATSLKNVVMQATGLTSIGMVIRRVVNEIKEGIQTVVDLDTALIDLKKTSSMTNNELADYYYDANEIAKELGRTTQEIIQTSADWSRLGYGSYEDATRMSKLAAQFASISPGMNIEESTDTLVSVMKAFDYQTNDVLDGIMSKINVVGNNFALSNADLAAGLMNSSSAMAVANNTLEETIALITAGTEITQNASKVGNGLRTISMRIRGMDEETEQLDESLVNIKSDISELTNGKVSIMSDPDTYKSTYEILRDISHIWDELTDKQQAGLLEKLFGKTRAQIGAAVIANFEAAESAMDKMANSAGNADAEMSIITESLEYKLNALKETGVGIWQNLFPREGVGNAIESLTKLAEGVDKFTEKFGLLGILSTGAGIVGLVKLFKNFGKHFALFSCEADLHKPSNCGEPLTLLRHNVA